MGEQIKVTAKKPLSTKENLVSNKLKTDFQSHSSQVDKILFFQRTIGNRAVQRLIKSGALQAKLRVEQPADKYEHEADRVAEQVMRMPEPEVQRQMEEEEESLMMKNISGRTSQIRDDLHTRLSQIKGLGNPLPNTDRNFMERRFGVDFSGVRVHTDSDTAQMSKELNAEAFTHGRDIYFGAGRYKSETSFSKKLLAHELTHVIQLSNAKEEGRIQCHECETAPLHRCPSQRVSTVVSAFQEAASWLPQARSSMENYIRAPTNSTNNIAASALRQHFNWTEDIRLQLTYPNIPQGVLSVINNSVSNITQPIHAFCPPTSSSTVPGRDIYAGSPTAWEGTNCYEFYEPFFTDRAPRGKIAIHEMMHSWESMNDVAYEGDEDYPPNVRAAQSNADSYAALIRDLGI